jgi:hypothetical protein
MLSRNNEKPWNVYILRDPRTLEVRYVGITTAELPIRLRRHVNAARIEGPTHRSNWIKGLSAAGLTPVIEAVDSGLGEWEKAEQGWIAHFRAAGARLTNGTDGGNGSLGHPCSDEYRERLRKEMTGAPRRGNPENWKHSAASRSAISAALIGGRRSDETKRKMSEARKGRTFSEATLAKMRAHVKSEEHRRKLADASRGHVATEATRAKMRTRITTQEMRRKRSLANTGEKHPRAKLTDVLVMLIRARYAAGETRRGLAAEFGVAGRTIASIYRGITWKHLPLIPRTK